jgi:hypothetical protein
MRKKLFSEEKPYKWLEELLATLMLLSPNYFLLIPFFREHFVIIMSANFFVLWGSIKTLNRYRN